ncbi:uncharacterized protein [Atheta coriaria]|uniref:uncharacterized protein isoform X2 n=1 Tax=Dalotia coriaria TaxID=877792 RepID=UPI0031F439EF
MSLSHRFNSHLVINTNKSVDKMSADSVADLPSLPTFSAMAPPASPTMLTQQQGAQASQATKKVRHSIAAVNITTPSLNVDDSNGGGSTSSSAKEGGRRRPSFLHLNIPDASNWRGSLTHLHLPSFSLTAPDGGSSQSPWFTFGGLGLRRHSHNTLHRSESMVSICFRSLTGFISDDNFEGFQQFLQGKQVQIDDRDENATTALMVAASKGRTRFVRELLEMGADPNAADADNWSALLCAAKEGHADICCLLLENNAEIEHRDMF